jgi:hypothetical protein
MRELLIALAFRVRAWLAVRLLLLEEGAHGRPSKYRSCPECFGHGKDWAEYKFPLPPGGVADCRRCHGKGRVLA